MRSISYRTNVRKKEANAIAEKKRFVEIGSLKKNIEMFIRLIPT